MLLQRLLDSLKNVRPILLEVIAIKCWNTSANEYDFSNTASTVCQSLHRVSKSVSCLVCYNLNKPEPIIRQYPASKSIYNFASNLMLT